MCYAMRRDGKGDGDGVEELHNAQPQQGVG